MKKENRLHRRRNFALNYPACFFSLTCYASLCLLITSFLLYLNQIPESHASLVHRLISLPPISSVSLSTSATCPSDSRLIFNYKLPGFQSSSCYRESSDNQTMEIESGWFRCGSAFFSSYKEFLGSYSQRAFNIGDKFLCGGNYEVDWDAFEYVFSSDLKVAAVERNSGGII